MTSSAIAQGPLHGVRIWLSGAIPDEATDAQRNAMLQFVSEFAATVFRSGGHILHGSHPTLTPTLLKQAKDHVAKGGRKDCLTMAVSKLWSKDPSLVPIQEWRDICMVYETPEASAPPVRDESLNTLRNWMAERCDAFVAVGGNWWRDIAGRAGVPIEAGLAIGRGIPCFLLAGLGGAAREYLEAHPHVVKSLKNGLDISTNEAIATDERVDQLVGKICAQLERLPLVRGRVSEGVSFRILALDGGGIKGAFTASVLSTFQQLFSEQFVGQFDLIAGTSTGGILAIGLGMGLSPSEMLKFYRSRGSVIFPIARLHKRWQQDLRHIVQPKYSQDVLRHELNSAYFPDGNPKFMKDSLCRLVVPAYDAISGVCHVFTTPHHELRRGDANSNAAEVALATAAAPTYFSSARVNNMISNTNYFDGGVWANCPAMAAIVEAVCYLDVPLDRIDILSIGTTEEPFTVKTMSRAGWLGWGTTLLELLMNAQVNSAIQHAQRLVGEPRFLRVNTITPPGAYALDDAKEIEDLIALGNRAGRDDNILHQVKSRFLTGIPALEWR